MKIIEIDKRQLLELLFNPVPFNQGQFGIITLIDNKLYKLNYKDFIDTYIYRDETKLDNEVDILLEVEDILKLGYRSPNMRLKMYSRLLNTKSNDLITGVLSYKGLYVGIEMKHYENFAVLSKTYNEFSKEELEKIINTVCNLVNDLMMHNIIPRDIKEDNILVNTETGEVKLIDLDGDETIYGPPNYINDFPYYKKNIDRRIKEMKERLYTKGYKRILKK